MVQIVNGKEDFNGNDQKNIIEKSLKLCLEMYLEDVDS